MSQRVAGTIAYVFVALSMVSCSRSRTNDMDAGAASGGKSGAAGLKGGSGGRGAGARSGGGAAAASGSAGRGASGSSGAGSGPIDGADAAPGSTVPVAGGYCCVPDKEPGCCMVYGGFTEDKRGCGQVCDGMPSPWEAWTRWVDDHGCTRWIEPVHWTDCCGCSPDASVCDATGTWKLSYQYPLPCGASEEVLALTVDDDGGTPAVTFNDRTAPLWQCGADGKATYEATAEVSPNGCAVTVRSKARGCQSDTLQCDELELTLYLDSFATRATVQGSVHLCACEGEEVTATVNGEATRL